MIAAIYARKSTEQTGVADEQKSVARQIDHARAYAERKGWTVTDEHIYVDDGISGAEFANRPGFLRLMNALKPRAPFQALVMSEESRLGREAIETAYALKQLVTAGVRVFFYLEDRERTLDSPTDKIMLSLTAFADELEREKARQRTYDAMQRKARAGHVTGGRVFGYDNLRTDEGYVRRVINETEAAVVRRIFEQCASGFGMKQITYQLNADSAPCPRPQRERPAGWAPASIREILYRELYRGHVIWNKTKKRDKWGVHKQQRRPESEWFHQDAPELRIVAEALWAAAHARLAETRALYLRHNDGKLWGHPARGTESKYLLVGLARCGVCGAGVSVRSRSHGSRRAFYYTCTANHLRGRHVCANDHELPMEDVNEEVREALRKQVLSPAVLDAAVARAIEKLSSSHAGVKGSDDLATELATIEQELARLTAAVAAGGNLASLLDGVRQREARRRQLLDRLEGHEALRRIPTLHQGELRHQLHARLTEWQGLLDAGTPQARQLLRKLVVGRLVMAPEATEDRESVISGDASWSKFFGDVQLAKGLASPRRFEMRDHRKVGGRLRQVA